MKGEAVRKVGGRLGEGYEPIQWVCSRVATAGCWDPRAPPPRPPPAFLLLFLPAPSPCAPPPLLLGLEETGLAPQQRHSSSWQAGVESADAELQPRLPARRDPPKWLQAGHPLSGFGGQGK
jgi:hypothetical protein